MRGSCRISVQLLLHRMEKHMKTLKKSLRGLTFSLEKDTVEIGSHFN